MSRPARKIEKPDSAEQGAVKLPISYPAPGRKLREPTPSPSRKHSQAIDPEEWLRKAQEAKAKARAAAEAPPAPDAPEPSPSTEVPIKESAPEPSMPPAQRKESEAAPAKSETPASTKSPARAVAKPKADVGLLRLPVAIPKDGPKPPPVPKEPEIVEEPPKNLKEKIQRELRKLMDLYWDKVGGESLVASLVIHLVLFLVAVFVVHRQFLEPKIDFLPGGGSKGAQEASATVASQMQKKKRFAFEKAPKIATTSLNAAIKLPDISADAMHIPDMKIPMTAGAASAGFGTAGMGGGFGNGNGIGGQAGFTSLPPSMRSRCSPQERLQKLRESGGTTQTETAVSRSLEWLKTKQNEDGSWGRQYTGAMTGLALLSYLGRCETPDSPFYGDQSMKGIMFLMELAKKNKEGCIATNPASHACPYEHGIATYALGEMYSLARLGGRSIPGMKETFEQGVKLIIDYQMPSGSWSYGPGGKAVNYVKSGDDDLSVTGWQYQALKAAKYSGLHLNGLQPAIDKAVKYLERTQTKDGGFGMASETSSYNQWSLTGVGVLGLQTLGPANSKILPAGLKFSEAIFAKDPPDWSKNANLYCWYYYTQTFFQAGGSSWKKWNDGAMNEILTNQKNDGSWNAERPSMQLASTEYAGADADVYRTTLCTLMLEVYYRYLKVGDRQQGSIFQR
jgi:Prenyltransferase and squalene oxidase repeat